MDDFLENLLSSSPWADVNDSSRSSWDATAVSNANGLLSDSLQPRVGEKNHSVLDHHADVKHTIEKGMYSGERLSQQKLHSQNSLLTLANNEIHDRKFSLPVGSFESAVAHRGRAISSSIESNESELSILPQSFGDVNSNTSLSTLWPSSYSSISSVIGQGKLHDLGFQGIGDSDNVIGRTHFENSKFLHLDAMPPVSTHMKDPDQLHEINYASFSSGQQMHLSTGAMLPQKETNALHHPSFPIESQIALNKTNYQTINSGSQTQAATTNTNSGNGAVKPRVRARRGQATDPHSIAERLRREKIAERMKNLQELVPNSNKADKASMLDEIIDYVKFLQLQVKVLSMSRLGAAGAVVPLLTDGQTEGSGSLLLSTSFGQDGSDLSDSEDSLAFEQEVVKLMETNITNAMQYLQHKGVCLMPIALASAISGQKGNSIAIPPEQWRTNITNTPSSHSYVDRMTADDEVNGCNASSFKQQLEAQKTMEEAKEMVPRKIAS